MSTFNSGQPVGGKPVLENGKHVNPSGRRFAIALSFPSEHHELVRKVAERLAKEFGKERIFYDAWYTAELTGVDLDTKLRAIYRENSDIIVPFFSEYYEKKWCGLEWSSIRAHMLERRKDDRVIPVKLDETVIPGWEVIDKPIVLQESEAIAKLLVEIWVMRCGSFKSLNIPIGNVIASNEVEQVSPAENESRFQKARIRLQEKLQEELADGSLRTCILESNELASSTTAHDLASRIFAIQPGEYADEETGHPLVRTPMNFVDACRFTLNQVPIENGTSWEHRQLMERLWRVATLLAPISFCSSRFDDLRKIVIGTAEQAEVDTRRRETGVSLLAQFLGVLPQFDQQSAFNELPDSIGFEISERLKFRLYFCDGPLLLQLEPKNALSEIAKSLYPRIKATSETVESVDAALRHLAATSRSYVCLCMRERLPEVVVKQIKQRFPFLYIIVPTSDCESTVNEYVFLQLKRLKEDLNRLSQ